MNNQDEISSVLLLAPSLASITKKLMKVVAIAYKLHMYDHLGGRTSVALLFMPSVGSL